MSAITDHLGQLTKRGYPGHQLGIEFLLVGSCNWVIGQTISSKHLLSHRENVVCCNMVGSTHRQADTWHKSSAVALMHASTATCGSVASSSSFLLIPGRFSDECYSKGYNTGYYLGHLAFYLLYLLALGTRFGCAFEYTANNKVQSWDIVCTCNRLGHCSKTIF